jgi:acetyl esterase/lipase
MPETLWVWLESRKGRGCPHAQDVMSTAAQQLNAAMTVANMRDAMAAAYQPNVRDFVAEPADIAGVPAEWVTADGIGDDAPVAMYLHGGAFSQWRAEVRP